MVLGYGTERTNNGGGVMIKWIRNVILFAMCIAGLCLIASEMPETASTTEILFTYGGGIALLCIPLLIWDRIDSKENEKEQKGGKYYGIR